MLLQCFFNGKYCLPKKLSQNRAKVVQSCFQMYTSMINNANKCQAYNIRIFAFFFLAVLFNFRSNFYFHFVKQSISTIRSYFLL